MSPTTTMPLSTAHRILQPATILLPILSLKALLQWFKGPDLAQFFIQHKYWRGELLFRCTWPLKVEEQQQKQKEAKLTFTIFILLCVIEDQHFLYSSLVHFFTDKFSCFFTVVNKNSIKNSWHTCKILLPTSCYPSHIKCQCSFTFSLFSKNCTTFSVIHSYANP